MCVLIVVLSVMHNAAENSSDNLPTNPPDNHHHSDVVYWMDVGWIKIKLLDNSLLDSKQPIKMQDSNLVVKSRHTQTTYSVYMMTPLAHMSTGRPYPEASSYIDTFSASGARYPGVPHSSTNNSTSFSLPQHQSHLYIIAIYTPKKTAKFCDCSCSILQHEN